MSDQKPTVVSDCRKIPSRMNCSLVITGTEEEVLPVAIRHAIIEHEDEDTPELRETIKKSLYPISQL